MQDRWRNSQVILLLPGSFVVFGGNLHTILLGKEFVFWNSTYNISGITYQTEIGTAIRGRVYTRSLIFCLNYNLIVSA